MSDLRGNLVVAQSGGPTAVINSSLCGVVQAALEADPIEHVFAARNGVLGILNEDLMAMGAEDPATIEALRRTPAAAAGSCRYKLKDLDASRADYERILEVFRAQDVRIFCYIGGNDSMDTADKVAQLAATQGYELRVMGVPKTIDNDLAFTDHTPGYGSVAKYLGTAVMEAGRDTEALYTADTCTVMEVMGRNAGWIAAATGVAHRTDEDAPHLIYLPEVPFSLDRFVEDVKACVGRLGRCFIVVGEGLRDADGNYLTTQADVFSTDAFGHRQLGGVAEFLKEVVAERVGVKCRYNKPGTAQREAMHFASRTDSDEAYLVGRTAVEEALKGTTGFMVTLVREPGETYACTTGLAPLSDVANGEKFVPREFINEAGNHVTDALRAYVSPLMRGEVPIEVGPDGLPVFARFKRVMAPKRTGRDYSPAG